MKFTKMHGIGNDYVYMDCTKERLENPGEIARLVSDRHKGIGSDGLILIQSSDEADFEMAMYNADGSYGKMCGNGIRCVAKYVYDNGLTDKTEISVISGGAVKYLKLTVENGKVKKVRVNMGEPILKPSEIPVVGDGDKLVAVPIVVDNQVYEMTCVSPCGSIPGRRGEPKDRRNRPQVRAARAFPGSGQYRICRAHRP